MALDVVSMALSKGYTKESLVGGGAMVGKNVTVSSITPIDGGNRVTFSYTLDNGTTKTSTMDVMNGVNGTNGKDGTNGRDGVNGKDGADGYTPVKNVDYFDGKDGVDGQNGKDGTNGKDGVDGQNGLNGQDGLDGVGISKIEKISTVGLVDTYRITFTDGNTFEYQVTNGKNGTGGDGSGASTWDEISDKPFESIDDDTLSVDNGVLSAKQPKIPTIPTKVSELENDNGYLTVQDISEKADKTELHTHENKEVLDSISADKVSAWDNKSDFSGSYNDLVDTPASLPASDVSDWAKAETKPTYTASEVGADESGSASTAETNANKYTDDKIAELIGTSPENLDTIEELGAAISSNQDAVDLLNKAITDKVDKEDGKSLVSDTEIERLASVDNYDDTDIKKELDKKLDKERMTQTIDSNSGDDEIPSADAVYLSLQQKIDKEDGKSLISTTEIERLSKVENYDDIEIKKELNKKLDKSSMTQTISDNSGDDEVPSADAVFLYLQEKVDKETGKSLISTSEIERLSKINNYDDTDIKKSIEDKVDKVEGKSLSTNDYTEEDKTYIGNLKEAVVLSDTSENEKLTTLSIETDGKASLDGKQIATVDQLNDQLAEQFKETSGNIIEVKDSTGGIISELHIEGKSEQLVSTGKNLIQSVTNSDNINSTYIKVSTEEGKTYTFTYYNNYVPNNRVCTFTAKTSIENDGTTVIDAGFTRTWHSVTNPLTFEATYTGDFYIQLWNNQGNYFSYGDDKYMFEEGDTSSPYEPYTNGYASPSVEYVRTISSVADSKVVTVKYSGKNLINYPFNETTKTANDLTWTDNGDGTVTVNGTPSTTGQHIFAVRLRTEDNKNGLILPAGTYRYTGTPSGGSTSTYYTQIARTINNRYGGIANDYGDGVTFTLTQPTKIQIQLVVMSKAVENITFKPQLEIGTVSSDFEKFNGGQIDLTLSAPLRSIGDVKDEITYQDGKWGVLRRIGEYTLTGTEGNTYSGVNADTNTGTVADRRFSIKSTGSDWISQKKAGTEGTGELSNYFKAITGTDGKHGTFKLNSNYAVFMDNDCYWASVDEFKTWVQTNKPVFTYVLGTPTFEAFDDQDTFYNIKVNSDYSAIWTNDTILPVTTVKYPISDSASKSIENKVELVEVENRIDELESKATFVRVKAMIDYHYLGIVADSSNCKSGCAYTGYFAFPVTTPEGGDVSDSTTLLQADLNSDSVTSGSLRYCIRNGICHMYFDSIIFNAKKSNSYLWSTISCTPIVDTYGVIYPID
jgi:hypothetical protein